jgi:sarcosine oxidase subunit alpha
MTEPSPPAGLLVDPGRPLTLTFEGRVVPALAGQSVAAALYAAGVRVFSRSFKYHRPRGLFCVAGDCPNCLMQVDGRPNVRTCVEPVRPGQVVRHQNAWPSLGFDVLRVFDRFDSWLPVGFYYKRFHKPRWLWPIFEHVVRHVAGLGRIEVADRPDLDTAVEHQHAEVCVVGGGPAGLAAANAAADAGADVLLLERQPVLGGRLLHAGKRPEDVPGLAVAPARRRTLLGTTVFGLYEGNLLGAFRGDQLLKVRAQQVIVCTGARQLPVPFHNNDLPGIMTLNGVLRLARLYGVRAGKKAVVLAPFGRQAGLSEQFTELGIEHVATVAYPPPPQRCVGVVIQARGEKYLKGIRVQRISDPGNEVLEYEEYACDLLCLATESVPANELLLQGGMRFHYQEGRWQPSGSVPGLLAAGGAAGMTDLVTQVAEGRARGLEAAARVGYPVTAPADLPPAGSAAEPWSRLYEALSVGRDVGLDLGYGKRFVCLCEDVTVKDVEQAVAEGFDGIETLKRYSTVNMGPCQGKMCGPTAVALCARATGHDLADVGATTSRPPVVPVELAVLAAGQRHHPVRRTPLHQWHADHGARWMDAGQWKRPESYGDPVAEVRAVRTGVGLIDVSTLGKVELVGPDAAELLERVYLNRWADLKPGRARYGVACTEEGILFDDGVGARIGPDRFYLTATTGNAEAVVGWLEMWRATWRLDVTVLNLTSAFAAMNLAGPRAREVLGRLTGLDLAPAAFPYLAVRESDVAGVPCRLLRIGFVGELGYEIHCPSALAWHLWEALVAAGAEFGLRPFGVEAQRVLRLEKGHLIIGQDTDALSTPLDAGLGGLVRFEKPLFHGRETLLQMRETEPRQRLVGFVTTDPGRVPPEGCQVVEGRAPVGRVTSARFSPTQQRALGLAWVPARCAAPGSRFVIHADGADVAAEVAALPFYDPDGGRLRS